MLIYIINFKTVKNKEKMCVSCNHCTKEKNILALFVEPLNFLKKNHKSLFLVIPHFFENGTSNSLNGKMKEYKIKLYI